MLTSCARKGILFEKLMDLLLAALKNQRKHHSKLKIKLGLLRSISTSVEFLADCIYHWRMGRESQLVLIYLFFIFCQASKFRSHRSFTHWFQVIARSLYSEVIGYSVSTVFVVLSGCWALYLAWTKRLDEVQFDFDILICFGACVHSCLSIGATM